MTHTTSFTTRLGRLMKWPRLCLLLGLLLARTALGTQAVYTNDAVVDYTGAPHTWPPLIDATNFVNNSTFTIDTELYETSDTINYTNNSWMSSDVGFWFDTQSSSSGLRSMAGSFYNRGEVDCGYRFLAWATNIVNPGTVDMPGVYTIVNPGTGATGLAGLLQITGQKVDLTRSVLALGSGTGQATGLLGLTGIDTNSDWDPSFDLGATYAYPSYPVSALPPPPFGFGFPNLPLNTTPYFKQDSVGTNLVIWRSVFIQDTSTNVSYNVYFDSANLGLGGGNATVEWSGGYVDPATGAPATNYLYLNDNYLLGVATNDTILNGIPENFTFTESSTPLIFLAPASPGFFSVFPSGFATNRYAYVSAQLIATSTGLNSIPNGAITNLPSRIQISASRELNLALAQISQPDYLSLQSSNQYDGNTGAKIAAPYNDLNLGVTNGHLTITNLLPQAFPVWGGTVQAWSTRWVVATTNFVGTNAVPGTNDFRVLIVASQLTPTVLGQVQDLILHATNSLIISDALNVMRTLSIDAQNLTLTTNGNGNGATSSEGALNLESGAILWQSALPNIRNLTNNGVIRVQNLAQFFAGTSNVVTVIPSTPAVAAAATLYAVDNDNVVSSNAVTIGTNTYTFFNTITNSVPGQVKIAATPQGSMSNLIAAINHAAGAGTTYSTNTPANPLVTAGLLLLTTDPFMLTNDSFIVTAKTSGSSGNSIPVSSSAWVLQWGIGILSTTLSGGADYVAATTNTSTISLPYSNFINLGLISDLGATINANYFENGGTFANNGLGSFNLQSLTTVLTNGSLTAGGDVSITTSSLVVSNHIIQAGGGLTLQVTNQLTDTGVTNGNIWFVGGWDLAGLSLPLFPTNNPSNYGDLLGTQITMESPTPNKQVVNTWAGRDRGISNSGYTNNEAVGRLTLDANGTSSAFLFLGTGTTSNALYVDELVLLDYAGYTNHDANGNLPALVFNTNLNLVIYYAQAITADGTSVAEKVNHKNNDHLRWVTNYAGYFSSTNITFPDGTTYRFNAALAQSTSIDSDNNGIKNYYDPTPFGSINPTNLVFTISVTNKPKPASVLQWQKVTPGASYVTNYVFYKTNLMMTNWLTLTNFITPASSAWPPVPVMMSDPVAGSMRAYRVRVDIKQ